MINYLMNSFDHLYVNQPAHHAYSLTPVNANRLNRSSNVPALSTQSVTAPSDDDDDLQSRGVGTTDNLTPSQQIQKEDDEKQTMLADIGDSTTPSAVQLVNTSLSDALIAHYHRKHHMFEPDPHPLALQVLQPVHNSAAGTDPNNHHQAVWHMIVFFFILGYRWLA